MGKNLYEICTIDPNSNCKECNLNGKLDCKLDKKKQRKSMINVFLYVIIAFFGLILTGLITGNWWLVVVFVLFIVLFFFVFEPKINCSHCPYYAENKKFMNCPGNNFFPKLWKYNPKPISSIEKNLSLFGFAIMGFFPLLSGIYNLWFIYSTNLSFLQLEVLLFILLFISTIISYLNFISFFLLRFCPKCVNFSCKFNKVPKNIVEKYLEKNPVIKDAWSENK